MRHAASLLRYLWASPASALGLLATALLAACFGTRPKIVQGVIEVDAGALVRHLPPLRFEAITLGHVVIGVSAQALARWRSHEHVHVRQYERWGLLLIPLYLGASAWIGLRGGDAYRDNPFERQAYDPREHRPRR
ncbi:hypothetical protein OPU71_14900 [Niveibacterium sp. 24ML]|uniref:hypothetical protein n=1 Tax=Niveibacterium sp. 24ML TaxID=2985512 RepID=UPI0022705024|nr:hypothetical protein [Niveibacterium sp. 24ML]MCX9157414.1 hypothetical protein [Niveibacterium sp. 24ML]